MYDVKNHVLMYEFFQKFYSFKAFVFSNSTLVREFCNEHNVTVISDYQRNPYNMPYLRDLFLQAIHRKKALYYGYVNGDIVLSPAIFELLNEVRTSKTIPPLVHTLSEYYSIARNSRTCRE